MTTIVNTTLLPPRVPTVPVEVDERAARESLLEQVAKLETELGRLFCSAYPRQGFEWSVRSRGGPRLLSLAELEQLRDDLAERLAETRCALDERTKTEEGYRRLIEEMQLEPERHKWIRVANEDIGEPGCKHWHVRPRAGLIGMLMGWWRVRISSGCPLAGRVAPATTPSRGGAGPPSSRTSRSRAWYSVRRSPSSC
jgi:hypothetical protein